jgi:hypothetical protein
VTTKQAAALEAAGAIAFLTFWVLIGALANFWLPAIAAELPKIERYINH